MDHSQRTLLKLTVKSKLKTMHATVRMDAQANTETLVRMLAFGTTLLFAAMNTNTVTATGTITDLKLATYAAMAVIRNAGIMMTDENLWNSDELISR